MQHEVQQICYKTAYIGILLQIAACRKSVATASENTKNAVK